MNEIYSKSSQELLRSQTIFTSKNEQCHTLMFEVSELMMME